MSDIGAENVTPDLSRMSLKERAKLALLIEADGDSGLRGHLLGVVGRPETACGSLKPRSPVVPERWTQIHVLDRLEEAFLVLSSLPANTRPRQFGNAMPTPVQERPSLKDLLEMADAGESFEEARNRVRLAPTTAQITRMEQALRWPFEHLADEPELARAVSLRALWAAMKVDIRKRCEQRGIWHDQFNYDWQRGLGKITGALIARRVPVS